MLRNIQRTILLLIKICFLLKLTQTKTFSSMYSKLYWKSSFESNSSFIDRLLPGQKEIIYTKPTQAQLKSSDTLLISTTVNFRHGERTSSKSGSLKAFYKLNCGKYQVLTPQGAMSLAELGQRLFQRYYSLISSHSLFISSAKNRCLQSLLNFLQGFRDLGIKNITIDQLKDKKHNINFFKERNITLLHECNGSKIEYFEVSKKMEIKAEESAENDDVTQTSLKPESRPVFEVDEPQIEKFKRQIRLKSEIARCPWSISLQQRRDKDEDLKKIKRAKQRKIQEAKERKKFYTKVLDSILAQINFSKFMVLWESGISLFSKSKSLSREESLLSEMCHNYTTTLSKNMLGFITGEVKDIKFCFYNPTSRGKSTNENQDPALIQKGIFVADKG